MHLRYLALSLSFFSLLLSAQTPGLILSVRKSMGFNNGSQIQGSFRLEASGPADLASVTFKIDGTELGTATAAPFVVNFRTDDYAPGWHALSAVGQTRAGATLTSDSKRFNFLTSEEAWRAMQSLIVPLLGAVGIAMLVGVGIQFAASLGGKKASLPLGAPRHYGVWGGAVCPKCGRAGARHWWGLNISFTGKFDRCDHCRKWSLMRSASPAELAAAEVAELAQARAAAPMPEAPPGERFKQQLDESRFMDDG